MTAEQMADAVIDIENEEFGRNDGTNGAPQYRPWPASINDRMMGAIDQLRKKQGGKIYRHQRDKFGGIVPVTQDGNERFYMTRLNPGKNKAVKSVANEPGVRGAMGRWMKQQMGLTVRGRERQNGSHFGEDWEFITEDGIRKYKCCHCGLVFGTYEQWLGHFRGVKGCGHKRMFY